MQRVVLVLSLVWCAVNYRETHAQGFWYVPPGGDYSYRYGLDLGNGLGFGYSYGLGYGSMASPEFAVASAGMDLVRLQGQTNRANLEWMNQEEFGIDDGWNQWTPSAVGKLKSVPIKAKAKLQHAKQTMVLPQMKKAESLSGNDLDRKTGVVYWPGALTRDVFASRRNELDSLVKACVERGPTTERHDQISAKVRELKDELRQQIREIPSKDYLEAKAFLNRLGQESDLCRAA